MRNTISKKYIVDYLTENYGGPRHDVDRMVKALRATANLLGLNKISLFHYIIERTNDIHGATSYGFDTRYGREIRRIFEHNYYA